MMSYSIAGGVSMGAAQLNESQLDRVLRRLRSTLRNLLDTLKQRGTP